jgi:hypothetical protein
MKLPKGEPATPEEAAEMLLLQRVADPRSRIDQALDLEASAERSEWVAAMKDEAQTLEAFHAEPLPPGFVVIFTIDAQRRTLYSLRVPPGIDAEPRLVATDMRVVLADAWDRYYTRWPDGVTPAMLERLVQEPLVRRCHLHRTFWEVALFHVAHCAAIHASNAVAKDRSRSEAERTAAPQMADNIQAICGTTVALRMGRLAFLTGACDREDPLRALATFHEDPRTALPWVALFSRYMNLVDLDAGRWWGETCSRGMDIAITIEEAERRMAVATGRASAAAFMMAMACAQELGVATDPESQWLAQVALDEAVKAAERIDVLRLMPRPTAGSVPVMPWAKRVLRKGSPRLFKILKRQFERFGMAGRPPGEA